MSRMVTAYGLRRDGRVWQRLKVKASSAQLVCETLSDSPFFLQVVADPEEKASKEPAVMSEEEIDAALTARRRMWEARLAQSGCGPEEVARCVAWLETTLVNSAFASWVEENRISMRWDALANKPLFEAK